MGRESGNIFKVLIAITNIIIQKGRHTKKHQENKDPAHTHGFPLNHIDLVHAEVMLVLLLVAVHRTNMCPRGWQNKIAIKIPLPRIMCASVCERKTNAPRV